MDGGEICSKTELNSLIPLPYNQTRKTIRVSQENHVSDHII